MAHHLVRHTDVMVHHTASLCRDVSECLVNDTLWNLEVESMLREALSFLLKAHKAALLALRFRCPSTIM